MKENKKPSGSFLPLEDRNEVKQNPSEETQSPSISIKVEDSEPFANSIMHNFYYKNTDADRNGNIKNNVQYTNSELLSAQRNVIHQVKKTRESSLVFNHKTLSKWKKFLPLDNNLVSAISIGLRSNNNIESIIFRNGGNSRYFENDLISDNGARIIADSLERNRNVTFCDLQINRISSKTRIALGLLPMLTSTFSIIATSDNENENLKELNSFSYSMLINSFVILLIAISDAVKSNNKYCERRETIALAQSYVERNFELKHQLDIVNKDLVRSGNSIRIVGEEEKAIRNNPTPSPSFSKVIGTPRSVASTPSAKQIKYISCAHCGL